MTITRLALTDFRSHADALIAPGPGPGLVILTGANGAGKTNVLEAVSLLAPGRGLRRARLGEMAREGGGGGFSVAARVTEPLPFRGGARGGASRLASMQEDSPPPNPASGDDSPQLSSERAGRVRPDAPEGEGLSADIGTGTSADAPERRIVRINGAPASANALAEWLTILWLTPAMDRLFAEGAGERRRFLDRLALALHPAHGHHAARYEAAMRARNRLLAGAGPLDARWCAALEAQMAEHGAAIAEARLNTVAALGEALAEQPEGPFARAALALEGWNGDDLAAELARGRSRDATAGRALAGPHRADLAVIHLGKHQPAARGSTGEQKALLLAIVLAHAELVATRAGRRPILLLDEVAAHLDPVRRAALFERLATGGGQVWMTGVERALFNGVEDATWLAAREGAIEPS